jgi:hypothetical protein
MRTRAVSLTVPMACSTRPFWAWVYGALLWVAMPKGSRALASAVQKALSLSAWKKHMGAVSPRAARVAIAMLRKGRRMDSAKADLVAAKKGYTISVPKSKKKPIQRRPLQTESRSTRSRPKASSCP